MKQYTEKYWSQEIERSKKKRDGFYSNAAQSIDIYNCKGELDDVQRRLNVWWYLVNTLLPAYYSRVPKVEVSLKKKSGSSIYQIASLGLERATQYALDEHFDFSDVGYNAALQFLLVGQACLWVRYDANISNKAYEIGLIRAPDGMFYKGDGTPFDGDINAVQEKEGAFFYSEEVPSKQSEKAIIESLHYRDYLTSCGRNKSEIEWRSRTAYMTKSEVERKFGGDIASSLNYNYKPETSENTQRREQAEKEYDGKAKLEEIWCEQSGKVYWFHHNGKKAILEESDPPLSFEDFYPCVDINASVDPNSVVPTSDWAHCKDQVLEVERLTTRMHAAVQAVRANGAYDATLGDQIEGLLTGDLKLIPVKNWPSYKAKGGLASGVEMLNTDPYVKALQVIAEARNAALHRLYETLKISDLLRGVSDPTKTATANTLENSWGTLSLSVRQQMFAEFVSDAIAKLGQVIAEKFDAQTLFDMADGEEILAQNLGLSWEQVDAVYKDNVRRRYRIEIASDSLVALDERQDRAERVDLLTSAGSFFQQMVPMLEQYPVLAPFSMELMRYTVRSYKAGKELESVFMNAMNGIAQAAQAKQQQQQQQPPDPKQMEAQVKMQIAQMEAEENQRRTQIEIQRLNMDYELKREQMLLEVEKITTERDKLRLELARLQGDQAIAVMEFDRDTMKYQTQLRKEIMDTKQAEIKAQ